MGGEEITVDKSLSDADIASMKAWPTWGCEASADGAP